VRFEAAVSLSYVDSPPEKVIPILVEGANSEDDYLTSNAAHSFERMDVYPLEALPGFIMILGKQEGKVACKGLRRIGKETVLTFIMALRSEDSGIQSRLTEAFENANYKQADKINLLANLLYADDADICAQAAYSLGTLSPEAADTVPMLIRALWNNDPGVRWNAATALGKLGSKAAAALPALERAADLDDYVDVRKAVLDAIDKIGPFVQDPLPVLIEMLRGDDRQLRGWAVREAGEMGPDAKDTVPALIEILESDISSQLARNIAYTLAAIGPDAKDAVPALSLMR
jgi:HEAT repeat protein